MEEGNPFSPAVTSRCNSLLKQLMNHKYGYVFNSPVDPIALGIPHYFQVIKNPMDLGTIRAKLRSNSYSSPYEFAADVRLTFDNALEFNPEGDPVNDMAKTLSKIFESKWKAIEKKVGDVGGKRRLKEEEEEEEEEEGEEDYKNRARVFGKRKVGKEMPKIGYDKLMYVVSKFEEWSTDVPEPIVEFVKKHRTDLSPDEEEEEDDDDEMQLDMNMLHNNQLWELYELVTVCMDIKPNVDTAGGAVTTGATEPGDHMDEKSDY